MNPGERLATLEGLRGYAAFLVFLVHAFGVLAARVYGIDPDQRSLWTGDTDPVMALLLLLHRSHYGVDLFFVLSGLLMADLAVRRWPGAAAFLRRRMLRIYPAYALSTLLFGAIALLWLGQGAGTADIVGNALLLQGFFVLGIAAINPVSWSLTFEMAFYLALPALALVLRRGAPPGRGTLAALAVVFVATIATAALPANPKAIYFAYFALFVPGIALGMLDDGARMRLAARLPLLVVVAAWACFVLLVKLEALSNRDPAYYAASGLACALLVLKACDSGGLLGRLFTSPPVGWLGRHSYSFFLIHYLVVHLWGDLVARVLPPGLALAHGAVFLAGALAASLLAARFHFLLTERFYFSRSRVPGA